VPMRTCITIWLEAVNPLAKEDHDKGQLTDLPERDRIAWLWPGRRIVLVFPGSGSGETIEDFHKRSGSWSLLGGCPDQQPDRASCIHQLDLGDAKCRLLVIVRG